MKNKFLRVILLLPLLIFVNSNVASASNQKNLDNFFQSIKSAQPLKIEAARKKFVEPNSSADLYTRIIVNHFNATEYLKTLDKYGNVSPTAHDAPGILKKSKKGNFYLNSSFDTIDGNYRNFNFNKSGKLTSFEFKNDSGNYVSIKDSLQTLTINYFDSGTEIKSGIYWKLPNGNSFVQLDYKNRFGGLKSWSDREGYISDANGTVNRVKTAPLGCTNSGGAAVIEGTTSNSATIVKGTTSVFVIPMFNDCQEEVPNRISVPFLVN